MIIHDAFMSLKNDMIHSFFYWLTFVISSMFIFLFLVVSMSSEMILMILNFCIEKGCNIKQICSAILLQPFIWICFFACVLL